MPENTVMTALFNSPRQAVDAVVDLETRGFLPEDVSVLTSDAIGDSFKLEARSKLPEGAAVGAASGGVLGALVGGLTSVGVIATGGAGVLVAGPLVGALSGLGAGSAAGGIVGSLVGAGMSEHEAKAFAESADDDTILVAVRCTTDERRRAADEVLEGAGGDDVTHA